MPTRCLRFAFSTSSFSARTRLASSARASEKSFVFSSTRLSDDTGIAPSLDSRLQAQLSEQLGQWDVTQFRFEGERVHGARTEEIAGLLELLRRGGDEVAGIGLAADRDSLEAQIGDRLADLALMQLEHLGELPTLDAVRLAGTDRHRGEHSGPILGGHASLQTRAFPSSGGLVTFTPISFATR